MQYYEGGIPQPKEATVKSEKLSSIFKQKQQRAHKNILSPYIEQLAKG